MAVRVAFIGAGGIANAHMRELSRLDDAKMVAFQDVDRARADKAASEYGGKAYADYRQMLDAERPDAVYICVPPNGHVGQEEELASRGTPFFVEKPIANTLAKAQQIEQAVAQAGLLTSVGYHWRYSSYTDLAMERLAGQTIGMVLGYWMGGMPGVFWWRRMDMSGGQLVEQTTHIVDVARYLCGDIVEVYAAMATRALNDVEDFTVTDVGTFTAKFANGAVGTISNTCLLKGFGYTVELHVVTPDLVVEIGPQFRAISAGREEIVRTPSNAMSVEDAVFIEAVKTGDGSAIRSPYADAVKTLAVTLAANESAASGKPVKL